MKEVKGKPGSESIISITGAQTEHESASFALFPTCHRINDRLWPV